MNIINSKGGGVGGGGGGGVGTTPPPPAPPPGPEVLIIPTIWNFGLYIFAVYSRSFMSIVASISTRNLT